MPNKIAIIVSKFYKKWGFSNIFFETVKSNFSALRIH